MEVCRRASGISSWPPPAAGVLSRKDIYNEVLHVLRESNNQESTQPYFEQQLWAHFNRLSIGYAVLLTRPEDVLLHMRLLDLVKDPTNRPAIEVHLLQVHPMCDRGTSRQRPMYEITVSTDATTRTDLACQLVSSINNIGLKIGEQYGFSTVDGYSISLFKVYGWPHQEPGRLRVALEKEVLKIETAEWEIDLKHLSLRNQVASWSYCDLYKGTYYNQEVAIKVFKSKHFDFELEKDFAREFSILRKVRHKNVMQLIGACTRPPNLCIVTEFMSGGCVYDYLLKKKGAFKLKALLRVALDVAEGMNYLHQNNLVHGNLKAANLVMDENEVVKVAYFGVASVKSRSRIRTSETGTYRWMTLEVIKQKPYNHKADIYSFGVVLWELLTAKLPYEYWSPLQALVRVVQKAMQPPIPKNTHPKLAELIKKCWQKDSTHRPESCEIIETLQNIAKEVGIEGGKEKSS